MEKNERVYRKVIRIIVAEDHSTVRKGIVALIMESFPAAFITEAADGRELLEKLQLQQYDLVISDITMPHVTGLEALVQIKILFPGLPVLIISTHPEDQYALPVRKAGASGYICKEMLDEKLPQAIIDVCKKLNCPVNT